MIYYVLVDEENSQHDLDLLKDKLLCILCPVRLAFSTEILCLYLRIDDPSLIFGINFLNKIRISIAHSNMLHAMQR